jgi:hypothetical protein
MQFSQVQGTEGTGELMQELRKLSGKIGEAVKGVSFGQGRASL